LAWQGIRKRSWQTEHTSSSGGTGDAADEDAAKLIPSVSFLPSDEDAREHVTRFFFFCFFFVSFRFHGRVVGNRFGLVVPFPSSTTRYRTVLDPDTKQRLCILCPSPNRITSIFVMNIEG
jgi:hypothetical protein